MAYSWGIGLLQCQSVLFYFFSFRFWSNFLHPESKLFPPFLSLSIFTFRGSIVLQFRGSIVLQFCGSIVLQFCGSIVLQFCGSIVLQFCGSIVLQFYIYPLMHSCIESLTHSPNYFYISRFNCFAVLRFP